ncbi:MAG TPA: class I SAM-dependent rRNA methyltransferase, partial [Elusimicrobia bacterium]|nr:class I SAM-dependent rRNA methyltransferase [Elusimicrobiota bacterium]
AGSQPFRPDVILLDPPSFVPSKKHLLKALRTYSKLNSLALRALAPGGLLAASTCSHHVGREQFLDMLRHAQGKAQKSARLVALRGQAADHPVLLAMPETEYLHFAL